VFGNITGNRVAVGENLNLKCVGEYRSKPTWKLNGVDVVEKLGTVLSEEVNTDANTRTSLLTIEDATEAAGGRYQCVDSAVHQTDSDVFVVSVGSESVISTSFKTTG